MDACGKLAQATCGAPMTIRLHTPNIIRSSGFFGISRQRSVSCVDARYADISLCVLGLKSPRAAKWCALLLQKPGFHMCAANKLRQISFVCRCAVIAEKSSENK